MLLFDAMTSDPAMEMCVLTYNNPVVYLCQRWNILWEKTTNEGYLTVYQV